MHLPRQTKEDQKTSEDSNNPAETYIQDPSNTRLAHYTIMNDNQTDDK